EVVFVTRDAGRRVLADEGSTRISKPDIKSFGRFQVRIIHAKYRNGLRGLARGEAHRRQSGFVIATRRGHPNRDVARLCTGQIAGRKVNARRNAGVATAGDGYVDVFIVLANRVRSGTELNRGQNSHGSCAGGK